MQNAVFIADLVAEQAWVGEQLIAICVGQSIFNY